MPSYFRYGQKEITWLTRQDAVLGCAIARLGRLQRTVERDIFTALIRSIVAQQISTKAALTVMQRLEEAAQGVTGERLLKLGSPQIQRCGMSLRKAGYIVGIAAAVVEGRLDLAQLQQLSDSEVVKALTALNGVGEWTAEMLLIHALQRPDIVSFKDLGIRRGMARLYGLSEVTQATFQKYRQRYSPYGTVASIYLWQISSDTP